MSEHKTKTGIKGQDYRKDQRQPVRARWVKIATLSEKWMRRHGFVKKEKAAELTNPEKHTILNGGTE